MDAALLNSPRAIDVSVYVVRAFVQQRELLASNKDLGCGPYVGLAVKPAFSPG